MLSLTSQGREEINEDDLFTTLEQLQRERLGGKVDNSRSEDVQAPPQMRRNIALYEAGRALLGYITPDYDEVAKVRLHHPHVASDVCNRAGRRPHVTPTRM